MSTPPNPYPQIPAPTPKALHLEDFDLVLTFRLAQFLQPERRKIHWIWVWV